MHDDVNKTSRKWPRRLARGLSGLMVIYWLFIVVVSAIFEPAPWTWESYSMAYMVTTALVVTFFAWWRPQRGGLLLVLFGIIFSTFGAVSAGHNRWLAVLVSGFPFLVAGVLYLIGWGFPHQQDPENYEPTHQSGF